MQRDPETGAILVPAWLPTPYLDPADSHLQRGSTDRSVSASAQSTNAGDMSAEVSALGASLAEGVSVSVSVSAPEGGANFNTSLSSSALRGTGRPVPEVSAVSLPSTPFMNDKATPGLKRRPVAHAIIVTADPHYTIPDRGRAVQVPTYVLRVSPTRKKFIRAKSP